MTEPTSRRDRRLLHRRAVHALLAAGAVLVLLAAVAVWLYPHDLDNEVPVATTAAPVDRDLQTIEERGTLKVLFTYNATGYFIYRGEVMGFELRLLRAFAQDHGLDLEPVVVRDRREIFRLLNRGEGDVVAARLLADEVSEGSIAALLTQPLYRTPPALVQQVAGMDDPQLPDEVEEVIEEHDGGEVGESEREEVREILAVPESPRQIRARLITRPSQLAGHTVHLHRGSPYRRTLAELSNRLGDDIRVVELERAPDAEAAIEAVAEGTPRYTVAPENLAELQSDYFVNLEVQPVLGAPDEVVWAVRPNASHLRAALDAWLIKSQRKVKAEYATYFEDRRGFEERATSEYLTSETGRLCPYDEIFVRHAPDLGWDWRLLASQAFQESRFDPEARSWAGATGLLQLMPRTARELKVADPRDPEQNVAGAVRYLKRLDRLWARRLERSPAEERHKYVLASYNVGLGHILDARRLATEHGDDPRRWNDVAYWLLRESEKAVYTDPVVKFGFARGIEPVTYVELILERYRHYQDFVRPGEG